METEVEEQRRRMKAAKADEGSTKRMNNKKRHILCETKWQRLVTKVPSMER